MSRTLFTADTHFGHLGIIAQCGRPFADVRDMDEALIENWNSVVGKNDVVIHLGDFAHKCEQRRLEAIFDRLNGRKFLVIGNHDDLATLSLPWAAPPASLVETTIEGVRVVMCHYALRTWHRQNRGAIALYGHSHGRLPGTSLSADVGVDCWGYAPVTLDQIKQRLVTQPAPEDEGDDESEPTGEMTP